MKVKRLDFLRILSLTFLIIVMLAPYKVQAQQTIESCYNSVLTSVMSLGRFPTSDDVASLMQQCDGTFDEVDAVVEQCHQDKVNTYVGLMRAPTTDEMEQAIQECSALAQQTVSELIPDPCAAGPSGFESLIPEEYSQLYLSNDPNFLSQFQSICTEQVNSITQTIISDVAQQYEQKALQEYQSAVNAANTNNWIVKEQGIEIKYLTDSGLPLYNTSVSFVRNSSEANMIGTDSIWDEFQGNGLSIGLWDAGSVQTSHSEYQGRIQWKDSSSSEVDFHATHIAGTLVASGTGDTESRGMASKAEVFSYNWNNNISEILRSASTSSTDSDLLISNHSYGLNTGWTYFETGVPGYDGINWLWEGIDCGSAFSFCSEQEDYKNGLYNQDAYDLDRVSYLSPYHLMVKAAGNNASEGPESGTEHIAWNYANGAWSQIVTMKTRPKDCAIDDGYDCLMPDSTAKNVLTIGAVDEDSNMAPFSSRGPTDDGRIKPDLVAKGTNVRSTWLDGGYQELSGTSMATPVVAGSLLLLQEKYKKNNNNNSMRASTLKALVINTADDILTSGPDYNSGWGVINISRASQLLDINTSSVTIYEERLENNKRFTVEYLASDTKPLVATLVWTDLPGKIQDETLDPETSVLINDLDMRISNNEINFLPFVLNRKFPSETALQMDNSLDNVEQIVIPHPIKGEIYKIEITHKGVLQTDSLQSRESCNNQDSENSTQNHQCFSLIVSQMKNESLIGTDTAAMAAINTSGKISLYLPVIQYSGQNLSAILTTKENDSNLFSLGKFSSWTSEKQFSFPTFVEDKNFSISIPKVFYDGSFYSARLGLSGESMLWSISDISPVQ